MARFRMDFSLAGDAKAVNARWRRGPGIPWANLGDFGASPAVFDIPDRAGRVAVQVRPLGADRRPQNDGETVTADTRAPIENRNDPDGLTPVSAEVEVDGPALIVKTAVPAGENPDEYEVEVRASKSSVTAPEDAIRVGRARPGEPMRAHVCPGETTMRVHQRLVRREDGRASDWLTEGFDVPEPTMPPPEGHTNGFGSGTIVDRIPGFTPLEVDSGNLVFKGISLDDFDNSPGPGVALDDLASVSLLDLSDLPTEGAYRTPVVELDTEEDLMFQVCPVLSAHGSEDFSLDRLGRFPLHWPEEPDGVFNEEARDRNEGVTLDGDLSPVIVEIKIATSASASPTFTANDYTTYRPGEVRESVKAYSVEAVFKSRFGAQFTITNLYVYHWVFCKSRPWCLYADAREYLFEHETAGNENDIDWTFDGEGFDEVLVEVDWKGQGVTDDKLIVEVNGSASDQIQITPSGYDVDTGREFVRFTLKPRVTGQERRVVIEKQYRYTDGGSLTNTGTAGRVIDWADAVTLITSLRFTTDGAGFTTASKFRAWGRRHHYEV